MIKKLIYGLCFSLFLGLSATAQTTWWVTQGGTGDGTSQPNASSNLAGIISNAVNGDTVNIVGTYTQTALISTGKALNYVGISNGVLDGNGVTAGFVQLNTTGNISFTDLTFQNFKKSGPGAVIQTAQNAQVTITNCTFTNNTNSNKGGAINSYLGDFTITGCTFSNNTSSGGDGGGAISISGTADFTITNTLFDSNVYTGSSTSDGGGAILFKGTGAVNITGCTFTDNTSTFNGGAITTNQSVTISSTTFKNNTAAANGGGLFANLGVITLSDLLFDSNMANQGGAVYSNTGLDFSTSTLVNNIGTDRGGAMVTAGASTDAMTFTNLTFYNNSTPNAFAAWGGAIRAEGSGARTQTYTNCLIYDNFANTGATPADSDIWASDAQVLVMNNCIVGNGLGTSINTGDTNNNSTFNADLSGSSLAFVSPNVTFNAPANIGDDTPIDFGTDAEDVGAWDSNINLFEGTTDSDWGTATNWSNSAVPTASDNVALSSGSSVVVGATTAAVCNDLSVNASSSLTIDSGGSLIVSGTSTGNVTYNRTLGTSNWYLMSSPVGGVTFNDDFVTDNSIDSGTTVTTNRGVATYTTASDTWTYLQSSGTMPSTAGTAYSVKRTAPGTVGFTGTINTTDVTAAVGLGGRGGYNLLGNPYTSYVNSATFLTANTANLVSETIWLFNQATGSYETKVSGDGFILSPSQGFFVSASTAGNLTFAESNQASGSNNFQKSSKTEIKLLMTDGDNDRFAKIYYVDNATTGFDNGWDGETFQGISNSVDIFTHLLDNGQNKNYQVQSLPKNDIESMVIPVGIKATSGKEITISTEAFNLPQGVNVYLEDRANGTFTELSATANFITTLDSDLNGVGRFYLHASSSALSADSFELEGITIFTVDKSTLRLKGLSPGIAKMKLYNILGKQMMNASFKTTGVSDVKLPILSTGLYIVQIETEKGKLNKKIILK